MNILYVRNNNDRAAQFQLQTVIYEEGGQRYVKKQALIPDAFPHLKRMKDNYLKLSSAIVDPRIKLAEILYESENCLIFEFIDGNSFEDKFNEALNKGEGESDSVIDEYFELLKTGFKTTLFESSSMVTDHFRNIFGKYDYQELDGELCFDGISNIDLILSNIIFKDGFIYIIDYEWVFELNVTIGYAASRAFPIHKDLYGKMEKHLLAEFVNGKRGSHNAQIHYQKKRTNIFQDIEEKENVIQKLNQEIVHLHDIAQSLRVKNRIKRMFRF
ncbi:MAG: hypothetical protein JRJ68_03625 [Deltaproteobacteria bacterium]|nr:hypothetical protein [Deltaproteobacteria bacterium]